MNTEDIKFLYADGLRLLLSSNLHSGYRHEHIWTPWEELRNWDGDVVDAYARHCTHSHWCGYGHVVLPEDLPVDAVIRKEEED